ncbi:MAG: recombinase family protein [Lachnospiraceae bacterium]|nr:recombinase family protein [Lachnospiraceae bacterium]
MNYELMKYNIDKLLPGEVCEYLRKSRSDDPALSVEEVLQRHASILNDWAIHNLGESIPEENIFREIVSGETIADRPEVQKLLTMIESPRIKAILIVEPQRLSRGDLEDVGRIMKLIKYSNTLVITPTKIYDLQDKYDHEAFERELKRGNEFLEYTKTILRRGRIRSVAEGNYIGSKPPFGYDRCVVSENNRKYHTLKINEEQANIVRMIYDMFVNQDLGMVLICRKLNAMGIRPLVNTHWTRASIDTILKNIHYTGKVYWNRRKAVNVVEDGEILRTRPVQKDYQVFDGKHEAIISDELFAAAQEKMGRLSRKRPNTELKNVLAGVLYCKCGYSMSLKHYPKKDGSKRCASRLICDNQAVCHTGSSTYEEVYNRVKEILAENIADFEVQLAKEKANKENLTDSIIAQLEKRLQELNEAELKLWDEKAQNRGTEDEMPEHIFRSLKNKIKIEQAEVINALEQAKEVAPPKIDYEERIVRFRDALTTLESPDASASLKNRLLKNCIERIEYSREKPVRISKDTCEIYHIDKSAVHSRGNWFAQPLELTVKLRV